MHPAVKTTLKRVLGPVYGPPRAAFQYVRARRIVGQYGRQYAEARALYAREGGRPDLAVPRLEDVGVQVLNRPGQAPLITLPDDYAARIRALAADVDARFERTENCLFMPKVDRAGAPPKTADIPAVRNGDVITAQLRDPLAIPGLESLCQALLPEIERRFFASRVIVDKVYAYRNLKSRQQPQVSWLWHYDNHPTEVLKLMIYLTDVTDERAPLEYVGDAATGKPWMFKPLPLLGNSRVPSSDVDASLKNGFARFRLVGPSGTMILFDDNLVHRATVATEGFRDVLVFQIRPVTFAPQHYIDPKWTGSFEHVDVNNDPYDYVARPKSRKISG
jgi:hypothetical protein